MLKRTTYYPIIVEEKENGKFTMKSVDFPDVFMDNVEDVTENMPNMRFEIEGKIAEVLEEDKEFPYGSSINDLKQFNGNNKIIMGVDFNIENYLKYGGQSNILPQSTMNIKFPKWMRNRMPSPQDLRDSIFETFFKDYSGKKK